MTVAFAKFEVFCCCQGLIEKIDGYDRIWMARQMHRSMTYQLHRTIIIYVDTTVIRYHYIYISTRNMIFFVVL